jgi:alpha-tubulin suppressor-like RCC1 family protein
MNRAFILLSLAACEPSYTPTELSWPVHEMSGAGSRVLVLTEADGLSIDAGTVETDGPDLPAPVDPSTDQPIVPMLPISTSVAAGLRHACLVSVGQVTCWGDDSAGALGAQRSCIPGDCALPPGVMPTLPAVRDVAAGDDFTCATTMDDTVMCWGTNINGELGGSRVPALDPPTPVVVDDQPLVVARVVIRDSTACAIDPAGAAWCWGEGFGDQPQQLPLDKVTDISVGRDHGCAIAGGALQCWGNNINGQIDATLAASCTAGSDCTLPPTPIAIDAARVVVGARHTCSLAPNGEVTCWGSNEDGQLARAESYLVGPPALAFSDAIDLVAASTRTCALRADHEAFCWGDY